MDISIALMFSLFGFALRELHEYSLKKAQNKAYHDGYDQAQYEEKIKNRTTTLNVYRENDKHYPSYYPPVNNKNYRSIQKKYKPKHEKKKYMLPKSFVKKFQNDGQATMILNNN